MYENHLAQIVKRLRIKKGMSQEFIAEESGLSLRTIQRIENGESNPTGESLKRIASALNVTPDDIMDWSIKEDKKYLTFLNLSALTFLFFPLLGILIPFILWTSKKDKIKNINRLGRALINFEITWTMLLFFIPAVLFILSQTGLLQNISMSTFFVVIGLLYLFNLISILMNTIRITNEKDIIYVPRIKFLKR